MTFNIEPNVKKNKLIADIANIIFAYAAIYSSTFLRLQENNKNSGNGRNTENKTPYF